MHYKDMKKGFEKIRQICRSDIHMQDSELGEPQRHIRVESVGGKEKVLRF